MEGKAVGVSHDGTKNVGVNEITESSRSEIDTKAASEPALSLSKINKQHNMANHKGSINVNEGGLPKVMDVSGEVNMEASMTADDVIRAGGFGARDDISSFLPVASDSTDFEASLRDARDYEEPQLGVSRPGLGWTKASKTE